MTPQERAERAARYLNRANDRFEHGANLTAGEMAAMAQAEVALAGLEAGLQIQEQALSLLGELQQDLDASDGEDLWTRKLGPRTPVIPRYRGEIPEHLLKRSQAAREKAQGF